jgi:2-polyprenyl-6-methoxyphenol hydroxylase-like FAD-dependent oxidoreductase
MPPSHHHVLIVGGGPAGMMCGLLLSRAGVRVTVLEKHADFLRDFRGDTVHPSTLELFHQLDWLDELLELPHSRVEEISLRVAGRTLKVVSFRHLKLTSPFIAMMPQWDLLDFLAGKGEENPSFELRLSTEAVGVRMDEAGRVDGVRLASGEVLPATLVIAADGRRSVLREAAELPLEVLGAPMDVFWFRLDKPAEGAGDSFGAVAAGRFLVFIDRRSYLQCAFVFLKGQADRIRERGIEHFRQMLHEVAPPELAGPIDAIRDWDQVKLLDVTLDRLTRWHRPGLLAIGDAAHAMSPIGGVGINVAVQDAVAAANVLAGPLARGEAPDPLLGKVQAERWKAVTRMQAVQKLAQNRIIEPILERTEPIEKPALPVRLLDRFALLRRIPGRIVGLGFDPVWIESPEVLRG